MASICFGTDFDNTIISYDHIFPVSARRMGIEIPNALTTKTALRDYLRSRPGGEMSWQKLQADVYGPRIDEAALQDGFISFAQRCGEQDISIVVISHKTQFAAQNPEVDLRAGALAWMEQQNFFQDDQHGLSLTRVFFEDTRSDKINRIRQMGCTHFIDDMTEVLSDECFPKEVVRILLTDDVPDRHPEGMISCVSWREVEDFIFNEELSKS